MSGGDSDSREPGHGLFHALVLMGSALALGCGGISHDHTPQHEGTGGSTGGDTGGSSGTGGSSDTGGSTGAGGTNSTAAGSGSGLAGAGIIIASGGAAGSSAGTAGAAGELSCPPEQWLCTMYGGCSNSSLPLETDCSCDESLPTSPQDCRADQSFVCRGARFDSNGYQLAQPLAYECHCVDAPVDCQTTCKATFGDRARCLDNGEQIPNDTTLCDCAMIILR